MSMTESGGGRQPDYAVVRLDHGDVSVTQATAESMRRALLRHFERPGSPAREDQLTELRTNAARIGPDGNARAGGWLLEGRGDAFVWTERIRHGSMFHIQVAFLESLADGTWRVSGVETEYVPLLNQ